MQDLHQLEKLMVEVAAGGRRAFQTDAPLETHLYGIPVSGWLKDAGYDGKELYAFIHPRAPHPEMAKQVLREIAKK